jgi:hypothetical protein
MIILDGPYVSDFLIDTLRKNQIPVLNNPFIKKINSKGVKLLSDTEAVQSIVVQHDPLYTNSENAIGWISDNLQETDLPKQINLFKNKEKFRKLISKLYPDFNYTKVAFNDLNKLDIETIQKPFVVKPNVGFFSMGVHIIKNYNDWKKALELLDEEMQAVKELYPLQVMDATEFIIESYIKGKEYAVDCYFNKKGEPVVLNILEHQFSSTDDVSDRLYYTSTTIIKGLKDSVGQFLKELNDLAGLTNFPLHIEIRIDNDMIIPIEGNPMRFGGWCTTADLAYHAYGFNPYLYYVEQNEPDWDTIIKTVDDSIYSIIILNNATGYSANQIKYFDYDKLLANFENPLDLRKINYYQYPLFGFLFTKTSRDDFAELNAILKSDLKEYIYLN